MNIQDLISELQDIVEQYGEDGEVRIAEQPRWSFENEINGIQVVNLSEETCEECEGTGEGMGDIDKCSNCDGTGKYREGNKKEDEMVVYLEEGRQLGYLPGAVSEALGWR